MGSRTGKEIRITMRRRWNKKVVSLVLAAAVAACAMTGCGNGTKEIATKDFVSSSVVMTVGKDDINYGEIRSYCYFLKRQYEGSFGDQIWNYNLGTGGLSGKSTIGDEAKEEVINTITQVHIICAEAEEENVELTSDEKDQANLAAQELVESADTADRSEYDLNVSQISEIYQQHALAKKMYFVSTDEASTEVSDDEAATREEKEKVISQRQTDMFKKKYAGWMKDVRVNIGKDFWNQMEL